MKKYRKYAIKIIIFFLVPLIIITAVSGDDEDNNSGNTSNIQNLSAEQSEFIMSVTEYSYEYKSIYQVLTSVTLAQAIEESGWGTSSIAKNANNLFGMKGKGTAGSYVTSSGRWQKFNSKKESVEAYSKLISEKYHCKGVQDYTEVLIVLAKGGYCEGSGYTNKIKNHIESYNLTVFDNLTSEELEQVKKRTFSMSGNSSGEPANMGTKNERVRWLFPDGVPSSEKECRKYLTTISVEILDKNGRAKNVSLTCHKKLAGSIQSAYREMKEKGFRAYDNGCFNWRAMTGSTKTMSNHSFGFAVDINPAFNPYVKGTSSSVWNNAPSYYKIDGEIVAIWKRYGFYWGGDYKNIKDYMHFEYVEGSLVAGKKY